MKMASIVNNRRDYLLTMFFILVLVSGEPYSDTAKSSNSKNHISSSAAIFITKNNTKVVAQLNGVAILPCVIKWSPSGTVSWIRRRDFRLLTVGLSTYSSDERFLVEHARHMGHWSLRIKTVREEDKGLYECQLSIHPTQSIFVELEVVEAAADVTGAPDLHIDEGSTLRLECKLIGATENPSFVFWYHDNEMVNYNEEAGFIVQSFQTTYYHYPSVKNSHVSEMNSNSSTTTSQTPHANNEKVLPASVLIIQKVDFKHAGNYTCAPSKARSSSITVHVLRGEKPAAMQHGNRTRIDEGKSNSNSIKCKCQTMWFLVIIIITITIVNHLNFKTYNKINR